jgi:hypothetical protein
MPWSPQANKLSNFFCAKLNSMARLQIVWIGRQATCFKQQHVISIIFLQIPKFGVTLFKLSSGADSFGESSPAQKVLGLYSILELQVSNFDKELFKKNTTLMVPNL